MRVRAVTAGAVFALTATLLSAPGPVAAQMMGGAAAAAGNGVGGREFGNVDSSPTFDAAAEYARGVAELQAGKLRDAERDFGHALLVDANNVDALTQRGVTRERDNDPKGAAHDFGKALKIDPSQITARREYVITLAKLGQADKAQAQFATLKQQAQACGDACPRAADLKAALTVDEAAVAPGGGGR